MFEDLFSLSGLSLERLKSFADIVSAGGMSARQQMIQTGKVSSAGI